MKLELITQIKISNKKIELHKCKAITNDDEQAADGVEFLA